MTIARPVAAVFAFLIDTGNTPSVNPNLIRIEGHSGPLEIGAGWVEVEKSWGRVSRTRHEVVELTPGERLVIQVDSTVFSGLHTISLHGSGDSTRVVSSLDYRFTGWMRAFSLLAGLLIKPYMRKYLRWFKASCEATELNRRPPQAPA